MAMGSGSVLSLPSSTDWLPRLRWASGGHHVGAGKCRGQFCPIGSNGSPAAQRERFAAFGIDLADLFVPGQAGYFEFFLHGYETVAGTISALAAPSVTEFLTAVGDGFQEFRQEQDVLTHRPLAAAHEHFAEKFHNALRAWAILNNEQVAGLFVDWWVSNQDALNQLRRSVGSRGALTPGIHAATLDRIGAGLSARAKKPVAQQQKQLADAYQA